jgi:hypothetical protein
VSLQSAIYESHQKLGRLGASYAIWLEPPKSWEVIPALELLTTKHMTNFFERAILEWTDHPEEEDIRAAASRFMRRYLLSVAAPAFVALANGVAWDLTLERISIVMRPDLPLGAVIDLRGLETFTTPERPSTWPVGGTPLATLDELRARALRPLFADVHVRSFERVLGHVKVSPRLLWATAAENVDYYYDNALALLDGEERARYGADRERILFGDALPGIEGENPIRGLLEWDDFRTDPLFPRPLQVRTICCVNYVVPGRNPRYCRTCGLQTPEQRHELWRQYANDRDTATVVPWPPKG